MAFRWYNGEFSCVDRKSASRFGSFRRICLRVECFFFVLCVFLLSAASTVAQSPTATISGIVLDPSGKAIVEAGITIVNDATRVQYSGKTNSEGIYVVPNIPPGLYRLQVVLSRRL